MQLEQEELQKDLDSRERRPPHASFVATLLTQEVHSQPPELVPPLFRVSAYPCLDKGIVSFLWLGGHWAARFAWTANLEGEQAEGLTEQGGERRAHPNDLPSTLQRRPVHREKSGRWRDHRKRVRLHLPNRCWFKEEFPVSL